MASHDQLQILFTTIVYLHGMATPENRWADLVAPHVPNRLVLTDATALIELGAVGVLGHLTPE